MDDEIRVQHGLNERITALLAGAISPAIVAAEPLTPAEVRQVLDEAIAAHRRRPTLVLSPEEPPSFSYDFPANVVRLPFVDRGTVYVISPVDPMLPPVNLPALNPESLVKMTGVT